MLHCMCLLLLSNGQSIAFAEPGSLPPCKVQVCSLTASETGNGLQLTADDISKTLTQLCDIGNTDRATARAALKRAIQENMRGKEAITNRAAEILLLS